MPPAPSRRSTTKRSPRACPPSSTATPPSLNFITEGLVAASVGKEPYVSRAASRASEGPPPDGLRRRRRDASSAGLEAIHVADPLLARLARRLAPEVEDRLVFVSLVALDAALGAILLGERSAPIGDAALVEAVMGELLAALEALLLRSGRLRRAADRVLDDGVEEHRAGDIARHRSGAPREARADRPHLTRHLGRFVARRVRVEVVHLHLGEDARFDDRLVLRHVGQVLARRDEDDALQPRPVALARQEARIEVHRAIAEPPAAAGERAVGVVRRLRLVV